MAAFTSSGGPYAITTAAAGASTAEITVPQSAPALYFYVADAADSKVYKTKSSSTGTAVTLTKGSLDYIGVAPSQGGE
jgi:hypothetical protein